MERNVITFKSFFRRNEKNILLWMLAIIFSTIEFWYSLLFLVLSAAIGFKHYGKENKWAIVLIGFVYAIFLFFARRNPGVVFTNALWYTVLPFLAFLTGRNMGTKVMDDKTYLYWLFILMGCLTLTNFYITFIDVFKYGLINPERNLHVLDPEDAAQTITSRAMDLAMALSSICSVFYMRTRYQRESRWGVVFSVLALLCIAHYVSRTGIVILSLGLILGLVYQGRSSKTFLFLVLLVPLVYILMQTELFTLYAEREMDEDASFATSGGRTVRWLMGLQMLLNSPGGYTYSDFYAHNYWLDFGRDGGLISAVLLLIFNIAILIKAFSISLQKSKMSSYIRCITFTYVFICFVAAFSEPIHLGAPAFTWTYMALCGFISTEPHKRICQDIYIWIKQ